MGNRLSLLDAKKIICQLDEGVIGKNPAVIRLLGRGGFADVFEVRSSKRENNKFKEITLAVKVINMTNLIEDRIFLTEETANREVKILNELKEMKSPYIMPIYFISSETIDDTNYIFIGMPVIAVNYKDYEAACGKYNEERTIKLGLDICAALEICHGMNILHRDIKPDNIFVCSKSDFQNILPDDEEYIESSNYPFFVLNDFGIGKNTQNDLNDYATITLRNEGFKPPEIDNSTARQNYPNQWDIFSLGAMLYWCVVDHPSPGKMLEIRNDETTKGSVFPRSENIAEDFWKIIETATQKNPEQRYKSAEDFREALQSLKEQRTSWAFEIEKFSRFILDKYDSFEQVEDALNRYPQTKQERDEYQQESVKLERAQNRLREELKTEQEAYIGNSKNLQKQCESLKEENLVLTKEKDHLEQQLKTYQEQTQHTENSALEKVTELNITNAKLRSDVDALKKESLILTSEKNRLAQQLKTYQEQAQHTENSALEKVTELNIANAKLRSDADTLRKNIKSLEEVQQQMQRKSDAQIRSTAITIMYFMEITNHIQWVAYVLLFTHAILYPLINLFQFSIKLQPIYLLVDCTLMIIFVIFGSNIEGWEEWASPPIAFLKRIGLVAAAAFLAFGAGLVWSAFTPALATETFHFAMYTTMGLAFLALLTAKSEEMVRGIKIAGIVAIIILGSIALFWGKGMIFSIHEALGVFISFFVQ